MVDEAAIRGVFLFSVLYTLLLAVATVLIVLDASRVGDDLTTLESASAAIKTLGNIGPGFGSHWPFGSYHRFANSSKLLMIVMTWFGWPEIVPALLVGTTSD